MCGLAGFIDMRCERKPDRELLVRMTDKLVHRGPDSAGYFVDHYVALGFRRLSIIDLESGDQPIYNEDGSVVLLCNGEIFNYRELKKVLIQKGHSFRTNSDVEVLLHLYEQRQMHDLIYEVKQNRNLKEARLFVETLLARHGVDSFVAACSEIRLLAKQFETSSAQQQVATAPCTDPIQVRFLPLRQKPVVEQNRYEA